MALATGDLTINSVFRLLPKVLGLESITLLMMFSGFAGVLNLLSFALQYGLGVGGLAASLAAVFFSIATSVMACFVHYAAIHAADMRLAGRPLQAAQTLWIASDRFWDCLAMALLMGLVVIVGTLLLIIPGIFLWIAFSLAVPTLALRRLGVSESMNVSWAATEGRRWRLLGIWLVYAVVGFIALVCISLLFAAVLHMLGLGRIAAQVLMLAVLDPVFTGMSLVVTGALSTTMFRIIERDAPEVFAA
ncbi:hypothetical protein CXZ10_17955 [Pleomorphomonas diazotrophica]|uniref:DUF7847 domain-containing protein n=1 Tax=Pleomorphomonas diazotrophica TaxID=1166257 RepID=A0A1I4TQY1_9HYPH|nr:hypothetical protein [Pleomorphomonas diazotrophica]PKR87618.1 hypothetical protein CXZ10_17955 [Pleomorphomonas diazotrophica]SFM79106.1 hypothetical protein SAMN05192571_10652 [Pleomorphomonas diazotrophica]